MVVRAISPFHRSVLTTCQTVRRLPRRCLARKGCTKRRMTYSRASTRPSITGRLFSSLLNLEVTQGCARLHHASFGGWNGFYC
jgi:hypothetical protein